MPIDDPLKPFDEICKPDSRQEFLVGSLEDRHIELSKIILCNDVPADVIQLFETAKNLSLYSYFVYRFHQASELIAFTAMEMALREKHKTEYPEKKPPMLSKLLELARDNGWIVEEKFSNRDVLARSNAQIKKAYKAISLVVKEKQEPVSIEDPTEEEIQEALLELNMVGGIVDATAYLRNTLAHGSNMLHPNSISTLRKTADVINQLFS